MLNEHQLTLVQFESSSYGLSQNKTVDITVTFLDGPQSREKLPCISPVVWGSRALHCLTFGKTFDFDLPSKLWSEHDSQVIELGLLVRRRHSNRSEMLG